MISFSNRVKKQITASGSQDECCMAAETYGLLLFTRLLDQQRSVYRTSQACVARRVAELIAVCCGVYVKIVEPSDKLDKGGRRTTYAVEIPHVEQRLAITGHFDPDINHIARSMFKCEGCRTAFLRGAFLAAGTVSDPGKVYHLEVAARSPELCTDLCALLRESGIRCSTLMRKSGCSAYVKSSSDIELLLGDLGAGSAYMELIDLRITREVRNKANRSTNCDEANIAKTVAAAGEQIAAIRRIEAEVGLGTLPADLRELAQLRLDNPEMTLRELGELLEPKLSRSGVNHRLQKLIDIAGTESVQSTVQGKNS